MLQWCFNSQILHRICFQIQVFNVSVFVCVLCCIYSENTPIQTTHRYCRCCMLAMRAGVCYHLKPWECLALSSLYQSSSSGSINHQIALQLFCLVLRTSYPCQTLQTAIHNIPKRKKKKASSGSHIGSSFSNKWLLISISKGFTEECWNRVMSSGVTGRIFKQRTASPLIITETVYPGTAVTFRLLHSS